ncbi:hypothetical protein QCE62_06955 [Caballeronia sp. LZ033]|uniref:hypothetical protein n=1 Tax=Caballeronia sp. LZ033 TaxID=3038566 RepID=UPI0028670023|nr:hypothetical protein [Caballeronia sp. LZ033]MDR5813330.1 hypothetical protein [Caballeronia sp. LZ033]
MVVTLPDGTPIAGVMSVTIEQGSLGTSPILTLRIFDFGASIESPTEADARPGEEL